MSSLAIPAGTVTAGFLVCLSCFPGLTTSLQSRTLALGDWFPVLLVFAYNTCDLVRRDRVAGMRAATPLVLRASPAGTVHVLCESSVSLGSLPPPLMLYFLPTTAPQVGKSLPSVTGVVFTPRTLPLAGLAHCLFIPAFVAVSRRPALDGPAGFLGTDEFAFALVAGLGLSTGYVTCSAMMLGPGCVAEKDRVVAGQMMTCCLMVGLFAGSMLGLLLSFASSGP